MARKKIEPLFEKPIKNRAEDKKLSVAKSSPTKKEVPIVKSKVNKKVESAKPVAKVKKSSPPAVIPLKKEIEDKTSEVKRQVKKEITIKKPPVKKREKVLPKSQKPTVKKVPIPKIKETKIEEPEEEQIEIQEEKKPAYVKESKRKPKVDKNAPSVNKKHTLKVGTRVIVTFLGQPEPGTIIELTSEGTYKVKSNRGIVFPRAKYELGEIIDKRYPSYIIKVL